jgi:hypothetical protein
MRSKRNVGQNDGNVLKRLRAGRRAANSFLTEPTQNQSLKSPITTVVKGTSPIKRSRASA